MNSAILQYPFYKKLGTFKNTAMNWSILASCFNFLSVVGGARKVGGASVKMQSESLAVLYNKRLLWR